MSYSFDPIVSPRDRELVGFSDVRLIHRGEGKLLAEGFESDLLFTRRESTEIPCIGRPDGREARLPSAVRLARDGCDVSPHTEIMHTDDKG